MSAPELPELEINCPACKGKAAIYNLQDDCFKDCASCNGTGFTPTPTGKTILELIRHNSIVTVSAELRVPSLAYPS